MRPLLLAWLLAATLAPEVPVRPLPGGATLVVEAVGPEGVAAVEVVVAAGPLHEGWAEAGLARLFTDPALQGAAGPPPPGWRREVQVTPRGMRIRGLGPAGTVDAFLTAEVARLAHPAWSDRLYRERTEAARAAARLAGPLAPEAAGARASPTAVTARSWQRRWWVPGTLTFVVVGDVDPAGLAPILAEALTGWQAPAPPPPPGPPATPTARWVTRGDARVLVLRWPAPWAARAPAEAAAWRLAARHLFGPEGRVTWALANEAWVDWAGADRPGPESLTEVTVWPRPGLPRGRLEAALAGALAAGAGEALDPDRLRALVAREAALAALDTAPEDRAARLATLALEAGDATAGGAWGRSLAETPPAAVHAALAALASLPTGEGPR